MDAYGDALVEAGISQGAIEWEWHYHTWGSLLEILFRDEREFDRFRNLPVVEAAFEAVPDRLSALLIHRGRGGSSGARWPRKPLPVSGSGAVALPLPLEYEASRGPEPRLLVTR